MSRFVPVCRAPLGAILVCVLLGGVAFVRPPSGHAAAQAPPPAATAAAANEFNDSHFHLTNYIQQGIDVRDVPADHGHARRPLDAVRHSAAAAVVVRATPATSRRPTTCRATRRSTTTRSPTPTSRCVYRVADAGGAGALRSDDHRLQPGRHVRASITSAACCTTFPGVFTGIGEFSIHKEFVSSKIAGETASLTNPALDRILDFAAEVGPRRDPPQRHRHAVREAGRRAGLPDADEGAAQAASERRRSSGRTSASAASSIPVQVSAEAAERNPDAHRDRRGDARPIPTLAPRELRHLVGRGREVRRRVAGVDRAGRGDAQHAIPTGSCSAPTRSRRPGRRRTSRCSTCGRRSGGS